MRSIDPARSFHTEEITAASRLEAVGAASRCLLYDNHLRFARAEDVIQPGQKKGMTHEISSTTSCPSHVTDATEASTIFLDAPEIRNAASTFGIDD